MSENYYGYEKKQRKNSKGSGNDNKGSKNVKVYFQVKQGETKYSELDKNSEREDADYHSKSNGGHYRQSSRQYTNNGYNNYQNNYNNSKNSGYNNKYSKREQMVWKKKQENDVRDSQEDTFERYDNQSNSETGFSDINAQIFVNEPQKSGRMSAGGAHDNELKNGVIPRDSKRIALMNDNKTNQAGSHTENEKNRFVLWDGGRNNGDAMHGKLDNKQFDGKQQGKNLSQSHSIPKQGISTGHNLFVEGKEQLDLNRDLLEKEKFVQWDGPSGEHSEFSKIDMIFEQKMKSNLLTFDENGPDGFDEPSSQQENRKFSKISYPEDDNDAPPEWGDVDVNEVKKMTNNMENLFFSSSDKQSGSYEKSINSQNTSSTFENSYSSKELSRNSLANSSRFEKIFSYNEEISSPDSDFSGSKIISNNSMNKIRGGQIATLEHQDHKIQARSFDERGGTHYNNNANFSNDLNRIYPSGGNTLSGSEISYNPYQQQQNLKFYQQQSYIQALNKQIQSKPPQKAQSLTKVFEKFSGTGYDKKTWFYLDRNGKRQGPFSGIDMDEWLNQGYLPDELLVTCGENNRYRQLRELTKKMEEKVAKTNISPDLKKLFPNLPNLAGLTSFQLIELMKNPDFVENAKKTGCNLNQLMQSLIQRELTEKQNNSNWSYPSSQNNTSAPVIRGTFDSQGVYYPVNNPSYSMRSAEEYYTYYAQLEELTTENKIDLTTQKSDAVASETNGNNEILPQNVPNFNYSQQQFTTNNLLSNETAVPSNSVQRKDENFELMLLQKNQQQQYQYNDSLKPYGTNTLSQNTLNHASIQGSNPLFPQYVFSPPIIQSDNSPNQTKNYHSDTYLLP